MGSIKKLVLLDESTICEKTCERRRRLEQTKPDETPAVISLTDFAAYCTFSPQKLQQQFVAISLLHSEHSGTSSWKRINVTAEKKLPVSKVADRRTVRTRTFYNHSTYTSVI